MDKVVNTVLQFDVGVLVAISGGVLAAWWVLATLAMRQFELRIDKRFDELDEKSDDQKKEHLLALTEIRRVENDLAECRIEASRTYMTKADSLNQHREIIEAIRGLGQRIDSLHAAKEARK